MKKIIRILYIIPISILVTMLVWLYRYMWFVQETMPLDRVMVTFLALVFTSLVFMNEGDY